MTDLLLDSNGDLSITNGLLDLTSTISEDTKQRLSIKFKTYLGEWYLDLSQGIPYFEEILKKGASKNLVDSIFKSIITNNPEIVQLNEFSSSIDNKIYYLNFKATTNSGDLVILVDQINF